MGALMMAGTLAMPMVLTGPALGQAAAAPREQTSTVTLTPPFDSADTVVKSGDCALGEICTSTAEGDAGDGSASCRSDVAAAGKTLTSGTVLLEQAVQIPPRMTSMFVEAPWLVTGTAAAAGDAGGNAVVRLQLLDGDTVLSHGGVSGTGLFVLGIHTDLAKAVVDQGTTPFVSFRRSNLRPLSDELTLRALLVCDAATDVTQITAPLPGVARIDVVGGDGNTRLTGFEVTFVSRGGQG